MMTGIQSAQRVSQSDASDNFVFRRSLLAYHAAAGMVSGDVLEIGTGSGYGVEIIAPHATRYLTIDKFRSAIDLERYPNVEFRQMNVPPIAGIASQSIDYVISFQVIEHIRRDAALIDEIARVLRPGGKFIVSTPNRPASLTRNPWHVREYTADELTRLLSTRFKEIDAQGVFGNERVMEYYEQNRRGVEAITRFDPLKLQYRLPRWMLKVPYDILNRLNRHRLLERNRALTASIRMEDYRLAPASEGCFDLFFVATKR